MADAIGREPARALDTLLPIGVSLDQAAIDSEALSADEALGDAAGQYGLEQAAKQVAVFAATQNDIYNSLVCSKLASELGRGKVYQLAASGEPLDERAALDKEWRGQVVGVPPLSFADLAGSRHATASAFFLEKLEMDEDVGDDEMALLIVRPSGDLVFVSTEMPKVDLVEGDRVLRVLRRKLAAAA